MDKRNRHHECVALITMENTTLLHADSETRLTPSEPPRPANRVVDQPSLAAGTVIGKRYTLAQEVGRGAMGVVYRAWDQVTRGLVAIKLVHRGNRVADRFRRGSTHLLRLRHPGVTEALACGSHDSFDYLVTKYYAGTSLDEALTWLGAWEPRAAVRLTLRLLDALDYVHRSGLIHRDVKPSNILLNTDESPVLADFDLAKPFEPSTGDSGCFSRSALQAALADTSGCLSGTPLYLPIERLRGEAAEPGDDLYAAGLVLYQLLCGRLPAEAGEHRGLTSLIEAREKGVVPPSELGVEIPRALERVVLRALSVDPYERYETGADFSAALRRGEGPASSERLRVLPNTA